VTVPHVRGSAEIPAPSLRTSCAVLPGTTASPVRIVMQLRLPCHRLFSATDQWPAWEVRITPTHATLVLSTASLLLVVGMDSTVPIATSRTCRRCASGARSGRKISVRRGRRRGSQLNKKSRPLNSGFGVRDRYLKNILESPRQPHFSMRPTRSLVQCPLMIVRAWDQRLSRGSVFQRWETMVLCVI